MTQVNDKKKLPIVDLANIAIAIVDKNVEDEMTLTLDEEASIYSNDHKNDSIGEEAASDLLKNEAGEEETSLPHDFPGEEETLLPWDTYSNIVNSYQDSVPDLSKSNGNTDGQNLQLNGNSRREDSFQDSHQQDVGLNQEDGTNRRIKKALGFFLAVLSGIVFTTNNFIIKGFRVVSTDLILVRSVVQIISLGALIKINRVQMWPLMTRKQQFLMLFQGLLGGVSMVGSVAAVTMMPVADALTIIFTSPLVTIILAVIFIGERLTVLKVFSGVSLTVGVVLVCRPPFLFPADTPPHISADLIKANLEEEGAHNRQYWIGATLSAAVAISAGIINVVVSQLKMVPSVVLVWWAGLGGLVLSLCTAPLATDSKIPSSSIVDIPAISWLLMFGLSVAGLLAYLAMTHALQLISPTLVSSLRSLEIVLSFLIGAAITGIPPSLLSIGGGTLVTLGVITVALESRILNRWRLLRWRSQYQQI